MVSENKVYVNRRAKGRKNSSLPPSQNIDTLDLSQLSQSEKAGFDERNLISTVWQRNQEGHYTLLVRNPQFHTAWKGTIRERKDGSIAILDVEENKLGRHIGTEEVSDNNTEAIIIEKPKKKAASLNQK